MATMPLFTLLLAQLFTNDEKPNRYSLGGFAIALVGVTILFGPGKLASLADQTVRQYAVVGAALCYGLNAIITKNTKGVFEYCGIPKVEHVFLYDIYSSPDLRVQYLKDMETLAADIA